MSNPIVKSIVFLILFFAFSIGAFSQKPDLKQLESYIQNAQEQWNVPGMAISIVQDGKIIYSKGFGVREFGKPEKITDETLFAIASNTKAFTASALTILADQGKLKLDDPVQKYLPWFKLYDPYVSANLTIRDLLCHRSGLKTFSGDLIWYGTKYSRTEVLERAKYLKPVYGFRERYGYSNILYLAAGEIIPAVTGKSWDDFIEEHFFMPLGMKTTNTSIKKFKKNGNIAMPHHVLPGETPLVITYVDWDNIAPGGSINSNVKELAEWIKLQLDEGKYNGKQIISEGGIREMRNVQISRPLTKRSEEMYPTRHYSGYGLGWDLFNYHGRNIVNHGGGADGMISKLVLVPKEKLGFVILTNSINNLPTALSYYILDLFLDKTEKDWSQINFNMFTEGLEKNKKQEEDLEKSRVPNAPASLPLNSFAGSYISKLYGRVNIRIENEKLVLYFSPSNLFVGDLEHFHFNTFTINLRNQPSLNKGTVLFNLDQNGKVVNMEVDIPNPDFDFTELDFIKE
jgi:CubicO group peptidase (beta-lactamase class C family)